jgi:hypothetical protein
MPLSLVRVGRGHSRAGTRLMVWLSEPSNVGLAPSRRWPDRGMLNRDEEDIGPDL